MTDIVLSSMRWVLALVLGLCVASPGADAQYISGGAAPTGAAGGDLSGTYPNPVVSQVNGGVAGTMANQNVPASTCNVASDGSNISAGTLGTGLACSSGALSQTNAVQDRSGAGAAIVTGDAAKTVLLGAFTYTLAQAGTAGFTSGWGACLLNTGASAATVNATTSVFRGASETTSLSIPAKGWACPASNGTDYLTPVGQYGSTTAKALVSLSSAANNLSTANPSTTYFGLANTSTTQGLDNPQPIPFAGTLKNCRFALTAAPGSTATRILTVYYFRSAAWNASSITVTFASGDTQKSDATNTLVLAADDLIDIKADVAGAVATASKGMVGCELNPS